MTNKEHFKEEIFEVACSGDAIAVNKETNKPCKCDDVSCYNCALHKEGIKCRSVFAEWLDEEYEEPCPFNEGELVEVSDDKECWILGYFVTFEEGIYGIRERKEDKITSLWVYCQKYGTLGGLVKGEQ